MFDPRGGAVMNRRYVPSILAAIGEVIETHMVAIGFLDAPAPDAPEAAAHMEPPEGDMPTPPGPACPNCGRRSLRRLEGCLTCMECGHSKCG